MAKILKGLEKKLKKFTRFTTAKLKAPRADDVKNELNKITKQIINYLNNEDKDKDKNKDNFKKDIKNLFNFGALRKYYKPGENDNQSYRRSGLAGLIFRNLYNYLTTGFIDDDPSTNEPDWFKCQNKTELKKSFERTYSSNNSGNDAWIDSVLYNDQVLVALITLIKAIKMPLIKPVAAEINMEADLLALEINKLASANSLHDMSEQYKKSTKLHKYYAPNDTNNTSPSTYQRGKSVGIILCSLYNYISGKDKNKPTWCNNQITSAKLETWFKKENIVASDILYNHKILNSLVNLAKKICKIEGAEPYLLKQLEELNIIDKNYKVTENKINEIKKGLSQKEWQEYFKNNFDKIIKEIENLPDKQRNKKFADIITSIQIQPATTDALNDDKELKLAQRSAGDAYDNLADMIILGDIGNFLQTPKIYSLSNFKTNLKNILNNPEFKEFKEKFPSNSPDLSNSISNYLYRLVLFINSNLPLKKSLVVPKLVLLSKSGKYNPFGGENWRQIYFADTIPKLTISKFVTAANKNQWCGSYKLPDIKYSYWYYSKYDEDVFEWFKTQSNPANTYILITED